jgi:bifunctional non-homologous end joining protein LigD
LDYLRNGRGATAVCSYSLRNRPGALAAPLSWHELSRVRAPDQFRFANMQRRLARWPPLGRVDVAQALPQLRT